MIYDFNVIYVYVTTAMINFEYIIITRESHEHDRKALSHQSSIWTSSRVWSHFRANIMHRVLFPSGTYGGIYTAQNGENLLEHLEHSLITEARISFAGKRAYIHGSDQRNVCAVYFLHNLRRSTGYGSYTEKGEGASGKIVPVK